MLFLVPVSMLMWFLQWVIVVSVLVERCVHSIQTAPAQSTDGLQSRRYAIGDMQSQFLLNRGERLLSHSTMTMRRC